ncbi:MAG: response regulator transcription factor [Verrucomicrobiota bacterium]
MDAQSESNWRVFLVEDHEFQRQGLKAFIDAEENFEVCGEASQASGTVGAILESQPDAVILDISLPDGDGLEITKKLREALFSGAILVLTMYEEYLYAERMLRAGANGYVTKLMDPDIVSAALNDVLNGKTYLSEEWLALKSQKGVQGELTEVIDRLELLTDRQFQVLRLIGHGKSSHAIAEELDIALSTVDVHRSKIKEALEISDRNKLIHFAVTQFGKGK